MEKRNVPTNYAVTREQKRYIARKKMEAEGKKRCCRHGYVVNKIGHTEFYSRTPSYFALHWREYIPAEVQ